MNLNEAVLIQAIMFDSSSSNGSEDGNDDVKNDFDVVLYNYERVNENRRPREQLFIENVIYQYKKTIGNSHYLIEHIKYYCSK